MNWILSEICYKNINLAGKEIGFYPKGKVIFMYNDIHKGKIQISELDDIFLEILVRVFVFSEKKWVIFEMTGKSYKARTEDSEKL